MPLRGKIQTTHIPANNFSLLVVGTAVPELTAISITGLEEELEKVTLPDRQVASGGNTMPVELEIVTPAHHTLEQAAWELWYKEAQEPVSPVYKKVGTIVLSAIDGSVARTFSFSGAFPTKRSISDLDMENEGQDTRITWTVSADELYPL